MFYPNFPDIGKVISFHADTMMGTVQSLSTGQKFIFYSNAASIFEIDGEGVYWEDLDENEEMVPNPGDQMVFEKRYGMRGPLDIAYRWALIPASQYLRTGSNGRS